MMCRVCDSTIEKLFSMGNMPLVNSFLKKADIASEKKYDLTVGFCPNCCLVQLMNTVSPEDLFKKYLYFSSTSSSFLEHCKKTAGSLAERLGLTSKSFVLEIASNDGAMLEYFKKLGMGILGVDPAKNIAEVANNRGIPTLPEFFNLELAKRLSREGRQADLVYGANVLAHVPEILDFAEGVKTILRPKGTAVFEFPYIGGLLENKFDTIYHEHVFYYSLIALNNLFRKTNLQIYDVGRIPVQGGSLRIFASHENVFPISSALHNLEREEFKNRFNSLATYRGIERRIKKLRGELIVLLERLKKEGKRIAAYGAPAKGNILLNYFGIKKYLDFIVDKSLAKQGLYTPGTHLRVYPVEKIYEERPDCLLILCWNIYEEVIKQLNDYKENGGMFIIPVPKVKII